ncbi:glycosyltransferase [Pseudoalteromonas sp. S3178]|uniref:glycosyltransferase n=1 Tax=Pseudoalteromonas sp. S3178 TaxID=579532 RepID=UPI00110B495C|nr:glycosyltransferase [Pseudoalteromonas sp. S3178]TMP02600.1 glycosyltransferase [Pseudoalteromonas sp. S3178]
MKTKILYVVSNLRRTGPVNQLLNIINNLDKNIFDCTVLTLSPEPVNEKESRLIDYNESGIKVHSLNLSRIGSVLKGKNNLKKFISHYLPDIIQTQGLRADSLVCSIKPSVSWITTSRNFPIEDYPSKFGFLKGTLMAKKHMRVLASCPHLVSCSFSIAEKLKGCDISSLVISNGVSNPDFKVLDKPIANPIRLISVGSLIKRKNMEYIIDFAKSFSDLGYEFNLLILGDGPLREHLSKISPDNVQFIGNVDNVGKYLIESDLFISSSYSEGLPNTVLEAISYGLPVILSDIPPHKEITNSLDSSFSIDFSLSDSPKNLAFNLSNELPKLINISNTTLSDKAIKLFGAKAMSQSYQKLYKDCL